MKKCTLTRYVWNPYSWNKLSYYAVRFLYYKERNGKYTIYTRQKRLLTTVSKEEFNKLFVKGWCKDVQPRY